MSLEDQTTVFGKGSRPEVELLVVPVTAVTVAATAEPGDFEAERPTRAVVIVRLPNGAGLGVTLNSEEDADWLLSAIGRVRLAVWGGK